MRGGLAWPSRRAPRTWRRGRCTGKTVSWSSPKSPSKVSQAVTRTRPSAGRTRPEPQAFNASTWKEVADGLGPGLFDFSHTAGVFEVDLLGPVVVEATIKVGRYTVVVFTSSNGLGELNGNHARRVLEVEGDGANVRVDGVAVRDGWHAVSDFADGGGCIRVRGAGAALTLDGGAVTSGCECTGDYGVRAYT